MTATPLVRHQPRAAGYTPVLRVSGTLVHDADLRVSVGATPTAWLLLHIQPPQGLPYLATIDLGSSVADHMQAQAELPHLRAGAVVCVAAQALQLANDHGSAALRLLHPRDLAVFSGPIANPTPISTGKAPHHVD